jgi:hypothetical protein
VNAAEDHGGSPLFRDATHGISTQCVTRVDTYADDVTCSDRRFIEMFQCLVADYRIAEFGRGGSCDYK